MKPKVNLGDLTGPDGNVFAIISKVARALENAGLHTQAADIKTRCLNAGSYEEVLHQIVPEYVDVV